MKDGVGNEIVSTIDDDGESAFNIDELKFDELHVNRMYIYEKDILDVIPNLSGIKNLRKLDNPNRIQDIASKLNDLIDLLKEAANAQRM